MRKGYMNRFEYLDEQERLARLIYANSHGYVVPPNTPEDYMSKSLHPTEKACYETAQIILDQYFIF